MIVCERSVMSTLPLTGMGVVGRIITNPAVMDVTPAGLKRVALASGVKLV